MRIAAVILALLLVFYTIDLSAQTETFESKVVAKKFETNYNHGKFDSIFDMFSSRMQKYLPADKTNDFLINLKNYGGQIVQMTFDKYDPPYASYKTLFQKSESMVNIAIDKDQKINGLSIKPISPDSITYKQRNKTLMELPFKGEWRVYWGGNTKEQNKHIAVKNQVGAFDFGIVDKNGNSYKTDGKLNEDYYAFGKEIYSPCDAVVVSVKNDVEDNKPGEADADNASGNYVVLKTDNNEFLFIAHLKEYSVAVTQGQRIKQGELLGNCGNSGNSTEPQLHFRIQNVKDNNTAFGVKCYFNKILVNGIVKTDYSPVRGEEIQIAQKN